MAVKIDNSTSGQQGMWEGQGIWDFIQVVMSGRRVNVLLSKIVVSFGFSSAYCSSHILYPFLLQNKHQQNLDWINPCKSVITES